MRQSMNPKNIKKYSKKYSLDIVKIFVRGGTNHRKDLCLSDGTVTCLYPDGSLIKTNDKWG